MDPDYSILIVDDEPNIINSLKRLLRREGYRLFVAGGGDEALQVLSKEKIDLIISDGRMPGMGGIELLQKVKAAYPDVVRIILSGYTDAGEVASAINDGEVFRFILKPWNDDELKITLRHALEHRRLREENRQLDQRVREQNDELRELNANLEQAVEKKARQLLIRNRTLSIAQEILDQLPSAVIGVDTAHTVVQVNRRATQHRVGRHFSMGEKVPPSIPDEVQQIIDGAISLGESRSIMLLSDHDAGCVASCFPLRGDGAISGAVLVFCDLAYDVECHLLAEPIPTIRAPAVSRNAHEELADEPDETAAR